MSDDIEKEMDSIKSVNKRYAKAIAKKIEELRSYEYVLLDCLYFLNKGVSIEPGSNLHKELKSVLDLNKSQ